MPSACGTTAISVSALGSMVGRVERGWDLIQNCLSSPGLQSISLLLHRLSKSCSALFITLALTLAHNGHGLRIPKQTGLSREPRSPMGPRCSPTYPSWEDTCLEGLCSIFSLPKRSVQAMRNICFRALENRIFPCIIYGNSLTILSGISVSCHCWGSVAQYSLPGKVLCCEFATKIPITEYS